MTLLITMTAAVISTLIWYTNKSARKMKCGILCYMFWGASLMWLVDAAAEYFEKGAAFFQPSAAEMLNDTFLGLSVTVLSGFIFRKVKRLFLFRKPFFNCF